MGGGASNAWIHSVCAPLAARCIMLCGRWGHTGDGANSPHVLHGHVAHDAVAPLVPPLGPAEGAKLARAVPLNWHLVKPQAVQALLDARLGFRLGAVKAVRAWDCGG
jgi:hypothetical protein